MRIELLSIAVMVSAILAIVFKQRENVKMYSVFKPLTTILIITIATIIYRDVPSNYTMVMIAALFFSLIGDIFLIKTKYFLFGLSSFLIAHIGFILAFVISFGFNWNIIHLMVLILIGGNYFIFLRKDLKKYAVPVAIYFTVIIIMNWQAIGLIFSSGSVVFYSIGFASLLFSFSDSILAYSKFKKSFKIAEPLILSTYWVAIYIFTIAGLFIV